MAKKLSKEEWEQRIRDAGSGRYEFIRWTVDGEVGALKRCVVRCVKDGYEWSATVDKLVNGGRGCQKCAGNGRLTSEERIEQINSLQNIEFISWDGEYKNQKSKANVKCKVDGLIWSSTVNNLVNCGQGCPQCAGNRLWTAKERIEQINKLENINFISWVDGYKGSGSKANVRCKVDGFEWSASVNSLVNQGFGCPSCAGNRRFTEEERIKQINSLENVEFISWVGGCKNGKSKANVKCEIDGFEWSANVSSLVNTGSGCPSCAGNRRWAAKERIEQINKTKNVEFVSWVDGYNDANSKANLRCKIDGFEWKASVSSIVNAGQGCPKCAKSGYDPSKTGYLYALRSECGRHVKVGISNNPKRRHKALERATPFKFNLVEQFSGDGVEIASLEKHFHDKYERAGLFGFDGCTEWLISTPQLLEELRTLGDRCGI